MLFTAAGRRRRRVCQGNATKVVEERFKSRAVESARVHLLANTDLQDCSPIVEELSAQDLRESNTKISNLQELL